MITGSSGMELGVARIVSLSAFWVSCYNSLSRSYDLPKEVDKDSEELKD